MAFSELEGESDWLGKARNEIEDFIIGTSNDLVIVVVEKPCTALGVDSNNAEASIRPTCTDLVEESWLVIFMVKE